MAAWRLFRSIRPAILVIRVLTLETVQKIDAAQIFVIAIAAGPISGDITGAIISTKLQEFKMENLQWNMLFVVTPPAAVIMWPDRTTMAATNTPRGIISRHYTGIILENIPFLAR
jgi:hypothetical protein